MTSVGLVPIFPSMLVGFTHEFGRLLKLLAAFNGSLMHFAAMRTENDTLPRGGQEHWHPGSPDYSPIPKSHTTFSPQ